MKNEIKEKLFDELSVLSLAVGQPQSDERLIVYADILCEYDFKAVVSVLRNMAKTEEFFPKPNKIISKISGTDFSTEDLSNEIAGEIIESISSFGRYNEAAAKNHLKEKWAIVENYGGWSVLCETEFDNLTTVKAQLRDLSKAHINRGKRNTLHKLGVGYEELSAGVLGNNQKALE